MALSSLSYGAKKSDVLPIDGLTAAGNVKIHGNGINAVRQISRRFGWVTRTQACAASSGCIVRTVSFGHWKLMGSLGKLHAV